MCKLLVFTTYDCWPGMVWYAVIIFKILLHRSYVCCCTGHVIRRHRFQTAPLLISAQLFLLHAARNGPELPFLNYHTYHIL